VTTPIVITARAFPFNCSRTFYNAHCGHVVHVVGRVLANVCLLPPHVTRMPMRAFIAKMISQKEEEKGSGEGTATVWRGLLERKCGFLGAIRPRRR